MPDTALLAKPARDARSRAAALMRHETRITRAPVADALGGTAVGAGCWAMTRDAFLLRTDEGIALHYRRGAGVTLDVAGDSDQRDLRLWLEGTLYCAIAALNGLVPVHASAVAHDGRVYAFTGPAGAGKSTLVAALGHMGFAHFCDDTLVLDVSGRGPPVALPGHKRLKLWPEGAALAGVEAGEQVAARYPKHFVEPPGGAVARPLPLAQLIVLEDGDTPSIAPLGIGESLAVLDGDHHTAEVWRQAAGLDRTARFTELATLAARIAMHRFVRPKDTARFAAGMAAIVDHIRRSP